ncbi:hypothetical protein V2G26_019849 [Clonostachys chloroleuca]
MISQYAVTKYGNGSEKHQYAQTNNRVLPAKHRKCLALFHGPMLHVFLYQNLNPLKESQKSGSLAPCGQDVQFQRLLKYDPGRCTSFALQDTERYLTACLDCSHLLPVFQFGVFFAYR